jgi:hypothetical protein
MEHLLTYIVSILVAIVGGYLLGRFSKFSKSFYHIVGNQSYIVPFSSGVDIGHHTRSMSISVYDNSKEEDDEDKTVINKRHYVTKDKADIIPVEEEEKRRLIVVSYR